MRKQYPSIAACISNVGNKRAKNEDDYYFYGWTRSEDDDQNKAFVSHQNYFDNVSTPWQFYAVFDGMGGGNFGEVASQTAARCAKQFVENVDNIHPYDISISLSWMCDDLNKQVFKTAKNLGTNKMGTTMSSLFFYKDMFWVCNLGDSKAFLVRGNKIYQISKDHTDEKEMKEYNITGRKPYVTQYLGIDPEELKLDPHIRSGNVFKDDVFVICSDGLTDMVPNKQIGRIVASSRNVGECAERLMSEALNAGGVDNTTIIVIA